jgi:hypothetical protein
VTRGEAPGPVEIRVEPDAREYLRAHGGAVTLRGSRRHGCCGGTAFVPVAEPGPPADMEHYRAHEVDGITVYLERDVRVGPESLVVGLDALWRWQRLRVEGTAMWM